MIYRIKKGRHRAWPLAFGIYYKMRSMQRNVLFDNSCRYDLPIADADDVNKLFGIGYLPGHHTDSARWGWNYNQATRKVRLFAYCYVDGERVIKFVAEVAPYRLINLSIDVIGDVYSFTVYDAYNGYHVLGGLDVKFGHRQRFGYRLGCFFGGNNAAPQEINIEIKKK